MAEAESAAIAVCRDIARIGGHQAVVILTVARDGVVTVSSWAETRSKCRAIGIWAEGLWRHAVSVVPFRTVFGWGNNGVARPLSAAERATLGAAARAYDQAMGGSAP